MVSINPDKLIRVFDGTSDPRRWIDTLRQTASIANWPEEYAVQVAKTKLTGSALRYVETCVPIGVELTMAELEAYLVAQYFPEEKLIVRLAKFSRCQQEASESLVAFSARVRDLGLRTCESAAEQSTLVPRLLAQFVHGIRNRATFDYIVMRDPRTLEEAVRAGLECESQYAAKQGRAQLVATFSPAASKRSGQPPRRGRSNSSRGRFQQNRRAQPQRQQFNAVHHSGSSGSNGRQQQQRADNNRSTSQVPASNSRPASQAKFCTWCREHNPASANGHFRSECRARLQAENKCFFCKREGHRANVCPDKNNRGAPVTNITESFEQMQVSSLQGNEVASSLLYCA